MVMTLLTMVHFKIVHFSVSEMFLTFSTQLKKGYDMNSIQLLSQNEIYFFTVYLI